MNTSSSVSDLIDILANAKLFTDDQIITISHKASDDAAIVDVMIRMPNDDIVEAQGTSKRSPGDAPNRQTGYDIALARAIISLGHKLLRRADGEVVHADHIKAIRPFQIARTQELIKRGVIVNGTFQPSATRRLPYGMKPNIVDVDRTPIARPQQPTVRVVGAGEIRP